MTNPAFAAFTKGQELTLLLMITGTAICIASAIEIAKFS